MLVRFTKTTFVPPLSPEFAEEQLNLNPILRRQPGVDKLTSPVGGIFTGLVIGPLLSSAPHLFHSPCCFFPLFELHHGDTDWFAVTMSHRWSPLLQAGKLTVKKSLPGEEAEEFTSFVDTAVYTK